MAAAYPAIEVFCSYAHEDEAWLHKLEAHLAVLQREGYLALWHDRMLAPGTNKSRAIDARLETSAVILLLVSSDFLASERLYELEMQRALQRHAANQALIIPILVRTCDWQHAPLAGLSVLPKNAKPLDSWSNIDEALLEVAQGIRAVLENISPHSDLLASVPVTWNVPYPRNAFFTGQESLLETLHTSLKSVQTPERNRPRALIGLGGIGKTQLVIEYAYQHRQEYRAVFWAFAETKETLSKSYTDIARMLRLPQKDALEQEAIVEAVKKWLGSQRGWLLILDNADDLALLQIFLPTIFVGHILITTRTQATGHVALPIQITTLDKETGALLLLRRAGLVPPDAPLETALPTDIVLAQSLAQDLGGLPLALDQAGAYIEETACGLRDYWDHYQTQRAELLRTRRGDSQNYPLSVATTWSLSFERTSQRHSLAADLLCLCAFLAPDAIPDEVISRGMDIWKSSQEPGPEKEHHSWPLLHRFMSHKKRRAATPRNSPLSLDEAIAALRSYSLITRDGQARTLTIHRLVQVVLRDALNIDAQKAWAQCAVRAIEALYPDPDFANWPAMERLLPHMFACILWIQKFSLETVEAASLLNGTGSYLTARAHYEEAEPLLQRALAIREQLWEGAHPETAQSLNNLALLYRTRRKFEDAEPLYQRALAMYKHLYGPEDPEVATVLNNLALLSKSQERNAEALLLYQRALKIDEAAYGSQHPDVATDLNNLGELYYAQSKYQEAEPLLQQALTIRKQLLGATHPSTATSLNNLGELYRAQGKYQEAEPFLQQALAIREEQLGAMHPATATSLNSLGEFHRVQGEYEKAEPLLKRALTIREQLLGAAHPSTVASLNNLEKLYSTQGEDEKAESLLQRALTIHKQKAQSDDPQEMAE